MSFVGAGSDMEGDDPGCPGNGLPWFRGLALASVIAPSNIIAVADHWGAKNTNLAYHGTGSGVHPPDAWNSERYFWSNGGTVGWGQMTSPICGDPVNSTSDCFGARHNEGGNATFVDGHAKFLKLGAGGSGSNYSPNAPAPQTKVTDYGKYFWDPRYDVGEQHFCPGCG